jgi:hypothetical protein
MANVPMLPSSQDISEMKRLRDIMNGSVPAVRDNVLHGQYSGGSTQRQSMYERRAPVVAPPVIPIGGIAGREDVDAMRQILEKFHQAAGDTAEVLTEQAEFDVDIREAIQTKKTPNGAIIGKWEVRTSLEESSSGKTRKLYTVANPSTREAVIENLVILEAARAIVRYLNKGLSFDHKKIQEVVELEETFNRNRKDAARFKQRYERCQQLKEKEAGDVFASRYQRARAQALSAQDQICSILESIR